MVQLNLRSVYNSANTILEFKAEYDFVSKYHNQQKTTGSLLIVESQNSLLLKVVLECMYWI